MNAAILNQALDRIEAKDFNPFMGTAPRIPVSDDEDSGSSDIEMHMPDGHNIVMIEFDWYYSSDFTQDETGGSDGWENKEVDSVKAYVMDDDSTEIELDEKLKSRIELYLIEQISWER